VSEDYQREKIARGINLAFEKRPFSCTQIESIKHEIVKLKTKQITSKQVGKIVIETLKEIDEVAYLRFLSVYKSFGSASKFQKEAEKLTKDK
jgi:transcriptional repressor NrdR